MGEALTYKELRSIIKEANSEAMDKDYITFDDFCFVMNSKMSNNATERELAEAFKVVEEVLKNGFRIAIATPRIDVVDELFPRFQAAFENVEIGKYHGREYHDAKDEQFVICTTHQLLKFYHFLIESRDCD